METTTSARIETTYPTVIASCHRKSRLIDEHQVVEKHDQLCDVFEASLKYLATVLVRAYLHDGAFEPRVNQRFENLNRPSLGHWNELIREILVAYEGRDHSPLISAARAMYLETTEIPEEIKVASKAIRERLAGKQSTPRRGLKGFFDLLITYRNKFWKGHGAKIDASEYQARTGFLAPAMEALLGSLAFLVPYRLVYVKEVRYEQERYHCSCLLLAGINPEPTRLVFPWKIEARHLYLLFDGDDGEVDYALSLAPFLIYTRCTTCGQEGPFFLNEFKGKRIEFLSYSCGHFYYPEAYSIDVQNLLKFVKGEVDLAELISESAGNKIEKVKKRHKARQQERLSALLNMAWTSLEAGRPRDAQTLFEQALDLDVDHIDALMGLASCHLQTDDNPERARYLLERIIELHPSSRPALYGLGKLRFLGQDFAAAAPLLERFRELGPSDLKVERMIRTCKSLT
jgi:tetratricopeptide (TPR) repeat protein